MGLFSQRKHKLFSHYVAVMSVIAVFALLIFVAITYNQQRELMETQLVAEAEVLNTAVDAMWDFIDNEQDNINYDAEGNFYFKGLYCSLVGKSVGKLFTMSTGGQYELAYTRENPRNPLDAPDEFERKALDLFSSDSGESRYWEIVEDSDGNQKFRYVEAIYLGETCLDCHGGQPGEYDITGFEKEGLSVGDIGGAVSITIPTDIYEAAMQENILRSVGFFVLILVAVYVATLIFIKRHIQKPLGKLGDACESIGKGDLQVSDLQSCTTTRELDTLAAGIQRMAEDLSELYATLENRVAERTAMYKEANDALVQRQKDLTQAKQLLEQVNAKLLDENAYRTDIISIISHELRTPLTAILSYVDLWEHSKGEYSQLDRETMEKIKEHALVLLDMVNNVLDIARLEAGTVEIAHDVIDIAEMMTQLSDTCGPVASNKQVSLDLPGGAEVPLFYGDWTQIHNILFNLVGNAVKFTEPGGRVWVTLESKLQANDKALLSLEVFDTGIGIEPERLDGIFDRFVQAGPAISRKYRGTGLGLSLVKKSAEAMGGTVSVESEVGEGSVFRVILPVDLVCVSVEDEG